MYIPEYSESANYPDRSDPYWECAYCQQGHKSDDALHAHEGTCAARLITIWANGQATIKRLGGHGGRPRPTVSGETARWQILRALRRTYPGFVRDELIKTLQELEPLPATASASVLRSFMAFTG